jgi:hypothetical protein
MKHKAASDGEDDGDRRGCGLGREHGGEASGRGDHRDLPADQLGRQLRQSFELIIGPAVFDRHVLALNKAGVFEALAKSAQPSGMPIERLRVEKPDHRHRGLLRPRRERPRGRRAAEKRYELATMIEGHPNAALPLHAVTNFRP